MFTIWYSLVNSCHVFKAECANLKEIQALWDLLQAAGCEMKNYRP